MYDEDNVESEQMDTMLEQPEVDQVDASEQPIEKEEPKVPLAALQKMRKRAQEAELKAQWLQEQQQKKPEPQEEDNTQYESATRADLVRSQEEAVRIVEEKLWIKNNPEKYERINDHLPNFLKQRPNLASAINSATNRYEEAYELMDALTPKQQGQLRVQSPKKEAPNAPGGVPKSAALNAAVDLMSMSDKEFGAWRQSQKRR